MIGARRTPTLAHGLPQTPAAIAYAAQKHAGQRRGDGTPFILHPLEVASLLYHVGAADDVIAAGVLHDLIEKGDVTAAELRQRFGSRVTSLVLAVSDALTLFAADKLSKLRELRREAAADSAAGTAPGQVRKLRARRLRHYRRSLALLEERIPESPLVRELRDELHALLRDRALATAP